MFTQTTLEAQIFNPYENPDDPAPAFMFGCKHDKHRHLCDGVEELMHLLYVLGLKSPHGVLKKIGISVRGKRYTWPGKLHDIGYWPSKRSYAEVE